ncbi:hypothetical protein BJ742DRAFT_774739 [Cladochytrium replicatum]|nr:hypothetical protein BJ742DRAFT_774739 [Cladochytrium replicatum]
MHLTKIRPNGVEVPPQLPAEIRQQIIGSITTLNRLQNTAASMTRSLSMVSTENSVSPSLVSMQQPMTPVQASTKPPRVWAIHSDEKERRSCKEDIYSKRTASEYPCAYLVLDTHNVGKLNGDEFAVAMHLIYRKLNGHDLPKTLPPELVPPSTRKPYYGAASSPGNLHDPFLVPSSASRVQTNISPVSAQTEVSSPSEKAVIEARKRDLIGELCAKKPNLRSLDAQAHASKSSRADLEVQVQKLKSDVKAVHTKSREKSELKDAISLNFRVGDTTASSSSVRFVEVHSQSKKGVP